MKTKRQAFSVRVMCFKKLDIIAHLFFFFFKSANYRLRSKALLQRKKKNANGY